MAITRLTVRKDRIIAMVSVPQERYRYATPQLARYIAKHYPNIGQHACINGQGPTFSHVMETTSLPHILEHLVIDIQTAAAHDPQARFAGMTQWLDQAAGIARVEVSFSEDLTALDAFCKAETYLNQAVLICSP